MIKGNIKKKEKVTYDKFFIKTIEVSNTEELKNLIREKAKSIYEIRIRIGDTDSAESDWLLAEKLIFSSYISAYKEYGKQMIKKYHKTVNKLIKNLKN